MEQPVVDIPNLVLRAPDASAGDQSSWSADTMGVLGTIKSVKVGGFLLQEIKGVGVRRMVIVPNPAKAGEEDFCNAFAEFADFEDAGSPKDFLSDCGSGRPLERPYFWQRWFGIKGSATWRKGEGVGSDTTVQFTPSAWSSGGCNTGPGAAPDEILVHEMVHGVRQMKGQMSCVAMPDDYDTYDEFVAIVVANVFTSNKNPGKSVPLRTNHRGFDPLADPAKFRSIPENKRALERTEADLPDLVRNLKTLTPAEAVFNPFR